ncbi:MAG TPA: hypothetical protein VM822_17030 [Pseudolabrys sp.]|nr:hypothetical protein [Pseudolabrys sp.]
MRRREFITLLGSTAVSGTVDDATLKAIAAYRGPVTRRSARWQG